MSVTILSDIKGKFQEGDFVWSIIILCGIVFLITFTVNIIGISLGNATLMDIVSAYFAIPLSFQQFVTQPWTLFTHVFFHRGPGHLFVNVLMFYWFGQIYQLYLGNKYGWKIFIGGGVFGGLAAFFAFQALPFLRPAAIYTNLVGASGGIEAIAFAATAINPEHEIRLLFIGRVKLKYIALFSLLLNYLGVLGGNAAGVIAHLGGAAWGYWYMREIQKGRDVLGSLTTIKKMFDRKPSMKILRNETQTMASESKQPQSDKTQEQLDAILDKISSSGYDSLSQEEKTFLFQYSSTK